MPSDPEVDAALERARRIQRQTITEHRLAVDRMLPAGYHTCWHCGEVVLQRETHCSECGAEQRPVVATALPTPAAPHWAWGCTFAIVALATLATLAVVFTAMQIGGR